MVTHKQVQVLRRIRDYGVRSVVAWDVDVVPEESEVKLELDPKVVYVLGDESEVPQAVMLRLLEKGLIKRDMRNLTEYGKEVVEQADFELGED